MKRMTSVLIAMTALASAMPALAQNNLNDTTTKATVATDSGTAAKKAENPSSVQTIEIQRLRPVDARGLNVYEAPKNDGVPSSVTAGGATVAA